MSLYRRVRGAREMLCSRSERSDDGGFGGLSISRVAVGVGCCLVVEMAVIPCSKKDERQPCQRTPRARCLLSGLFLAGFRDFLLLHASKLKRARAAASLGASLARPLAFGCFPAEF